MAISLLSLHLVLSGCAFSKEDPNKDKDNTSGVAGRAGPLAQKDALKIRYEAAAEYHRFNVILEWEPIENCLPRLHRENTTTNVSSQLAVREEATDGLYRRVDMNQHEGHELIYTLTCLNSETTAVDIKEIKLPMDLVVSGHQNIEELAARKGFKRSDDSVSLHIERLLFEPGAILEMASTNVSIVFKRAEFSPGSTIRNYISEYQTYEVAKQLDILGRPGTSIELIGQQARGSITFDRKGYPGKHGEDGEDADQSVRPPKNAAIGDPGSFQVGTRKRKLPLGPGAIVSVLDVKCLRHPSDGPIGRQGYPGSTGTPGLAGGNTGTLKLKIIDLSGLRLNHYSEGGKGGIGGQGGLGGPGGEGGDPDNSGFEAAVRAYTQMPASQYSWEKVVSTHSPIFGLSNPCTLGKVGPTGERGEQPAPARDGADGIVEPIMIWNEQSKSYMEWR